MGLRLGILVALVAVGIFVALLPSFSHWRAPWQSYESYLRHEILKCLDDRSQPSWRNSCFQKLATRVSTLFSSEQTLLALAHIDKEDGIKQQCHSFVHMIGQNTYRESGNVGDAFARCRAATACGEGCYHGVIEAYVEENGTPASSETASAMCNRSFTGNEVNYDACVHGLGHAAMLTTGYDGEKALAACDVLEILDDRNMCYAGVFMEVVFTFLSPPASVLTQASSGLPKKECSSFAERYQSECYAAQSSYTFQMRPGGTQDGFIEAATFCATVPPEFAVACYRELGGEAVVIFPDARPLEKVCGYAPEGPPRDACFDQAIMFTGHGTAGNTKKMSDVCRAATPPDQEQCFINAGKRIAEWYGTRAEDECAALSLSQEEHIWCALGAPWHNS